MLRAINALLVDTNVLPRANRTVSPRQEAAQSLQPQSTADVFTPRGTHRHEFAPLLSF